MCVNKYIQRHILCTQYVYYNVYLTPNTNYPVKDIICV